MGTREVSPHSWRGDSAVRIRALRSRWRTASLASGWRFPTDWAVAEIDQVCEAVVKGSEPDDALVRLGRARALAGSGLGETLQDVAALHAVLTVPEHRDGMVAADPDAMPARFLRITALAWSDVLVRQLAHTEAADGLTGLASAAYLRARLREVYQEGTASGVAVRSRYVLVVMSPDLGHATGWSRLAAMVLLADVLRAVFDGGKRLPPWATRRWSCSPSGTSACPNGWRRPGSWRPTGWALTRTCASCVPRRCGWRVCPRRIRRPAGCSPNSSPSDRNPRPTPRHLTWSGTP